MEKPGCARANLIFGSVALVVVLLAGGSALAQRQEYRRPFTADVQSGSVVIDDSCYGSPSGQALGAIDCDPPNEPGAIPTCTKTFLETSASMYTAVHPSGFEQDVEFRDWEYVCREDVCDRCNFSADSCGLYTALDVYAILEATGHYELGESDLWRIRISTDSGTSWLHTLVALPATAQNSSLEFVRKTLGRNSSPPVDLNTFDIDRLRVSAESYRIGDPDGGVLFIHDVGVKGIVGSILRPTKHDPLAGVGMRLEDAYDTRITDPTDDDYYLDTYYEVGTDQGAGGETEVATFWGWPEGSNPFCRLLLSVTLSAEGHTVQQPDKWWIKYTTSDFERLEPFLRGTTLDSSGISGANSDKREVRVELFDPTTKLPVPRTDQQDVQVHVFVQRVGASDGGFLHIYDIRTLGEIPASLRPTQATGNGMFLRPRCRSFDCTGGIENDEQFDRTETTVPTDLSGAGGQIRYEFSNWEQAVPCRPFGIDSNGEREQLRLTVVRSAEGHATAPVDTGWPTDRWEITYTIDGLPEVSVDSSLSNPNPPLEGVVKLFSPIELLALWDEGRRLYDLSKLNVDVYTTLVNEPDGGMLNIFDIRVEGPCIDICIGPACGGGEVDGDGDGRNWLDGVLNPFAFTPDKVTHLVAAPPHILTRKQEGDNLILKFTLFASGGRGEDLNDNGLFDTEDTNGNGILDDGEDVGLDGLGPGDPGYPGPDIGEFNGVLDSEDVGFDGEQGDLWDENGNGIFVESSTWNGEGNGVLDRVGAYVYKYTVFTATGERIQRPEDFAEMGENYDPLGTDKDDLPPWTTPVTREITLTVPDGIYEVRFQAIDWTPYGREDNYLPAVYRFSIATIPEAEPEQPIRVRQDVLK